MLKTVEVAHSERAFHRKSEARTRQQEEIQLVAPVDNLRTHRVTTYLFPARSSHERIKVWAIASVQGLPLSRQMCQSHSYHQLWKRAHRQIERRLASARKYSNNTRTQNWKAHKSSTHGWSNESHRAQENASRKSTRRSSITIQSKRWSMLTLTLKNRRNRAKMQMRTS